MLNTMDQVEHQNDVVADDEVNPLGPAMGLLIGLGVSTLLWVLVGGLVWLARVI